MESHRIYNADFVSRIPRLLAFLLNYSTFNGFSIDTCVYLAPGLVRYIKSSCSSAVEKMIKLLEFREKLCLNLLHLHDEPRKTLDDVWGDLIDTAESYGSLGLFIASVSKSSQASQYSNEMVAIANEWRERQGQFHSTMTNFAHNLLFTEGLSNQSARHSNTLDMADMDVKFTMAMAMMERDNFPRAYLFLEACARDLRSTNSVYKDKYFPVMIELVKCCNILNQEEQGEATALEALRHRYSLTATRNQIVHVLIVLSDSLIGQSKYSEADKLLQTVLADESLSTYLKTVASLRLNKVRRRLGVLDVPAFTRNGALVKPLTDASDSKSPIRDECLEELSCTISFTQQGITENVAVANAVLDTASAIVARQPISTSNWRTSILPEQIAHVPVHRLQEEEEVDHQDSVEKSIDAECSWEIAPLCVLLLRDVRTLNRPMLALESVINSLNAEKSHGDTQRP